MRRHETPFSDRPHPPYAPKIIRARQVLGIAAVMVGTIVSAAAGVVAIPIGVSRLQQSPRTPTQARQRLRTPDYPWPVSPPGLSACWPSGGSAATTRQFPP